MSAYPSLARGTEKEMVSVPSHFNSFSGISQAGFCGTSGFGAPPLPGRSSTSVGLSGCGGSSIGGGSPVTTPQLFGSRAAGSRGRPITPITGPGSLSSGGGLGSNVSSVLPVSSSGQQQQTSAANSSFQSLFPASLSGYGAPSSAFQMQPTSLNSGGQQGGLQNCSGSFNSAGNSFGSGGVFSGDARQQTSPNNSSSTTANSHPGFSSSGINLPSGNLASRFGSAGAGVPVQNSSALSSFLSHPGALPSSGATASQDSTGFYRSNSNVSADVLRQMLSSVGKGGGGDGFCGATVNGSSSTSALSATSLGLSETDFPSLSTPFLCGGLDGATMGGTRSTGAAAGSVGSSAALNAASVPGMDFRSISNPGGLVSQSGQIPGLEQQITSTSLMAPSLLSSVQSASNSSIGAQQHHIGTGGGAIASRGTGNPSLTSRSNPPLLQSSSSSSNIHSITPNPPLSSVHQPQFLAPFSVAPSLPSVNYPGLGVNSQSAIPFSIAGGSNFAIGRGIVSQQSVGGTSSTNFAGLMKGGSSESKSAEFQINSEDFPALQGSDANETTGDNADNVTGTLTLEVAKDPPPRYPGDKSVSIKAQQGIQTSPDGTVTNIPSGMILDQFGIVGMLTLLRALDTDTSIVSLAVGHDLTTLGLNLNAPDRGLYRKFGGPWVDIPCRPQDIDVTVPPEYLTNHLVQERLAPLRLNRYGDDLLFFLFYTYGGDIFQLAAAVELYNRDWRYSKEERVWVTRAPGMPPVDKTNTYERGTYYVFDPTQWRKVTKEMLLEYDKLEDRPAPIAAFQPQRVTTGIGSMLPYGVNDNGGTGARIPSVSGVGPSENSRLNGGSSSIAAATGGVNLASLSALTATSGGARMSSSGFPNTLPGSGAVSSTIL